MEEGAEQITNLFKRGSNSLVVTWTRSMGTDFRKQKPFSLKHSASSTMPPPHNKRPFRCRVRLSYISNTHYSQRSAYTRRATMTGEIQSVKGASGETEEQTVILPIQMNRDGRQQVQAG
jgi:hypothetical protein